MTARGFYTLIFGAVLLLTALSVMSAGAFVLGCAALLAWLLSLVSVLCARLTFSMSQSLGENQVPRGGTCRIDLTVRFFTLAPIAPLALHVRLPNGRESEFLLEARLFGTTHSSNDFPCPHVGVFPVGVTQISLSDCFGLFSLRVSPPQEIARLTVLPNPRETAPILCSPGEGETSAAQRAQADRTTPEDTRAWQDGDEFKRVHWKLSMRRQALMVHTYDTPQRPDALVLLDCSAPAVPLSRRAAVIDALTETCAGVLESLLESRRITRMPLSGDAPREMSGQSPEALGAMLQALAEESFSRSADFSRVLLLASRRMRRTGSTVIITTQLSPAIADAVIALGRMGPSIRFTLVTSGAPGDSQEKLMHLLRASGAQCEHVQV